MTTNFGYSYPAGCDSVPDDNETEHLDAYGHLNWTVGNEDWLACFDAIRRGNRIAYHVVVDCESGGFNDCLEEGEIDVSEIDQLRGLPDTFVSIFYDNYPEDEGDGGYEDCNKRWNKHLDNLRDMPPSEDGDEIEDYQTEAEYYEELNRGYAKDRI